MTAVRVSVSPGRLRALALTSSLIALGACGGSQDAKPVQGPSTVAPPKPSAVAQAAPPPVDHIGPKPTLSKPKPFTPPEVNVFKTKGGITVWLVERHGLPLVSVSLVMPGGSSSDPEGKAGLASITVNMLDEGAGKRSAVEVSSAVNDLGATLSLGVSADGAAASLTSLKNNFGAAFAIFADVIARPRFDAKEWKRVSDLWRNGLKQRAEEPMSVSRVVNAAALYGPGTPYGHPSDGLLESAAKIDLPAVKRFYGEMFRPDRAVMVFVGDVTQKEVTDMIEGALGTWKAPAPAANTSAPQAAPPGPREPAARPKIVLVDRPDAPQSVIAVVREGVAVSDADAPRLELINTVLGGSFSSRLNQNLREEHHWAYGAGSSFYEMRGKGPFVAIASVETPATGVALKEMLSELSKMASAGLTADDLAKAKAQDLADLIQNYETLSGISRRLGTLARLGLPPSFDAEASRARQAATVDELLALAKKHVSPESGTIIVVGPRAETVPQLAAIGLGAPELWDAEGKPVTAASGDVKAKDGSGAAAKPAPKKPAPKK